MEYPIVIVEAGYNYLEGIDRLSPVASLAEAKERAAEAGYSVIDAGQGGGNCETTSWDGEMVHVVTVLPEPKVYLAVYPENFKLSPDSMSNAEAYDAAVNYAAQVSSKIKEAYPRAVVSTDIRPVGEEGLDGGVQCENGEVEDYCAHIEEAVFREGNFFGQVRRMP